MDATVTPLTEAEKAGIDSQLGAARQFLADYGSARGGDGLDGLDHAWASWLDRQRVDPAEPEPVINCVGTYLGQTIIEALGDFQWVLATDGEGTSLAIHGRPGSSDLLIYPANVVGRRYYSGATYFLREVHDEVLAKVQQLRG